MLSAAIAKARSVREPALDRIGCRPTSHSVGANLHELDIGVQRRVRWGIRRVRCPPAQRRRHYQEAPFTDAHARHPFVDAGEHLIAAKEKRDRCAAATRVNHDASGERRRLMNGDPLPRSCASLRQAVIGQGFGNADGERLAGKFVGEREHEGAVSLERKGGGEE